MNQKSSENEEMKKFRRLSREYVIKFNDCFPSMMFMDVSVEELNEMISKCLETGKPFEFDEEMWQSIEKLTLDV